MRQVNFPCFSIHPGSGWLAILPRRSNLKRKRGKVRASFQPDYRPSNVSGDEFISSLAQHMKLNMIKPGVVALCRETVPFKPIMTNSHHLNDWPIVRCGRTVLFKLPDQLRTDQTTAEIPWKPNGDSAGLRIKVFAAVQENPCKF